MARRLDVPEEVAGYRLGAELGRGGQAVVHLGTAEDGSTAAVKLYERGESAEDRFEKEILALRRVPVEYAARLLDSGRVDGRPYLVTEYIEGPTLRQRLDGLPAGPDGLKRLDPEALRDTALGTITALAAFHACGVVHRDFKPANVICARDHPHVIDFGIARRVGDTTTVWRGPVGTIAYMAPEQFAEGRAGFASDVFSWAVVTVHAATGRHPFRDEDDDLDRVIERIRTCAPDLAAFPGPWRRLLRRCLNKRPRRRPTAEKVRRTVLSLDGPVLAAPARNPASDTVVDPPQGPPVSWPWRRPLAAGLAAGALPAGLLWGGAVLLESRNAGCPQPIVLRAMVPAELQETLRSSVRGFETEQAGDGCRPVQVTVSAQPSLQALRSGLATGWADRMDADPQPDVLLLSSSAERAYVDPASAEKGEIPPGVRPPRLESLGGTGARSAMTVAATAAAWDVLEKERRDGLWRDLPGLLGRAAEEGIEVLRPSPDSAASGTLASLGFYTDPVVKKDKGLLNAFERQVTKVPLADAGAALCEMEELPRAVAIVPERVVEEYNKAPSAGRSTGCGTGRRPTTFPLLRVDGLHRLEYPLVRVVWPGRRSEAREEYAARFRDWFVDNAPEEAWPPGTVSLDPEALAGTQELFKETRGGRTFEFLFDLSGSMELAAPGGVPLVTARALTGDVLSELRENDRVGLAAFPSEGGGRDPAELLAHGPAGPEEVLEARRKVDGLEADEEITPLHRALAVRGEALNSADPEGVLVVFTDGRDEDVSDDAAREAAIGMGSELNARGAPRVVVVVLGGGRCADGVADLDERLGNVVCLAAGGSSYEELRLRLFVEIWR